MILHDKIAEQLPEWRSRYKALAKDFAEVVVDKVTIGQVVGGMRDIKSLVTDISYVDPAEGIRFRGKSIPEVLKALPKPRGAAPNARDFISSLHLIICPAGPKSLRGGSSCPERGIDHVIPRSSACFGLHGRTRAQTIGNLGSDP